MQPSRQAQAAVSVPTWLPVLFATAGAAIILLALDIIPSDPEMLNAPRWVILSAGLMFALAGLVMRLIPHRQAHPAWYMLTCALMCTTFFLVATWVAVFATGVKGSIGPFLLTGVAADWLGRLVFGFGALLLGFLTLYSWYQWWRALRGEQIDLR